MPNRRYRKKAAAARGLNSAVSTSGSTKSPTSMALPSSQKLPAPPLQKVQASPSQKVEVSSLQKAEATSSQKAEAASSQKVKASSSDTHTHTTSTENPPIETLLKTTSTPDTKDRVDNSKSELESGLDLQASTLCGRKLRRVHPERLNGYFRFGPEDQEWICLHFLECEDLDDDYWLEDEYVAKKFTTQRGREDEFWDGRWCFGRLKPKEQVPWYTKSLHSILHLNWMKVDDFNTRRHIATDVCLWFGITPDPRSIFWLLPQDIYAFYALDGQGQGGFYRCTEEMYECYLMATGEEDLRHPTNSTSSGPFTAYLPPLVREGAFEEDLDSDSDSGLSEEGRD